MMLIVVIFDVNFGGIGFGFGLVRALDLEFGCDELESEVELVLVECVWDGHACLQQTAILIESCSVEKP
jgi:hypothetical protein